MKATKLALAIAAAFYGATLTLDKLAAQVKAKYKRRDVAQQALLPAFAAKYKAKYTTSKKGKVKWLKGNKASATAKKALNRLLSRAFSKKKPTQSRTINVAKSAKAMARNHSAAWCRRFIELLRIELRG